MAKIDFEAIKRTTDLVAVIQAHGVALQREGKDWIGLCPFHDDKKPSLRVTPTKGLWHCMSCEAAGNVIQFVARKLNVSDHEGAVQLLGSLPGVQTAAQLQKKQEPPRMTVPPNVAADLLGRVAGFYQRTLGRDRAGLDYLASRSLTDPAMLETFRVGYCNGTLKSALPRSGEVIAQLQALGVLNAEGNEVFYGRVVVPILDASGVVVGLYGRRVDGPGAKLPPLSTPHLYLAGGHKAAFNAAAAQHATRVVFVESIFDALSVWQSGERDAAANARVAVVPLYGAKGWTEHHDALVRTTEAKELVLALDNDDAGRAATEELRGHLAPLAPKVAVRMLAWPEGVKDANAFFSSRPNANADFAALIANAEPQPSTPPPAQKTAGEEKLEPRTNGFALVWPSRRYEVLSVQRVNAARLRATVQAIGNEPGRFHVATLDLYNAKARRSFALEAARLFKLPSEVAESDLGRLLVAAEEYAASASQSAAVQVSESDKADAVKLGKSGDLMAEITRDLKRLGLVGEETNGLLLYLAMTTRKLDDPLAVQILSPSGAGKSHLQDRVLSLCPEEELIKLTSLSNQALFYKGEEALRHKCLALEEVAGANGARYALRNLISAKKLTIETTVKNPVTGRMETQVNTVHGPTAVFETTTQPDTDPETKSRYLILAVDESAEQTRAILEAQRQSHTVAALVAKKERESVLRRHHAFQRLLRPLPVANDYEPFLTYGDNRLTSRRDQMKYLRLIVAVAFLHQMQRPIKHLPALGDYIEVTLDDIAIANELALDLFGTCTDDLSAPSRRLAELIAENVEAWAAEQKRSWDKVEWGRRQLREAIQWTEARLRLHLDELVRLEYVQPLNGGFGSAFRYRLLVSPETIRAGNRTVPGIRSVEDVRRVANLAGLPGNLAAPNGHLAGQNGHLAATSQPALARLKSELTVSRAVSKANGHANLASGGGEHMAINGRGP